MGIPCYFSSIIRKYNDILFQMGKQSLKIDNLYIDSNSIIYDSLSKCDITQENYVEQIYDEVIFQLEQHILDVVPLKRVIIAFDGVAPMAKIQQQRERRFKSGIERKVNSVLLSKDETWDTSNITPGTVFMKNLMSKLELYFDKFEHIKIYSSESPGEGEHKIFEYIRNEKTHLNENTVIYGLDADLIMLCISHSKLCKNLYLYRETPHFIRAIEPSLIPNETYLLDTTRLIKYIQQDINGMLDDYIFVCFMLGNDFLPHFPALCIRTSGMDTLLQTYKRVFKKGDNKLIKKNGRINWHNFKIYVKELSRDEKTIIEDEYIIRDKWEDRRMPVNTAKDKMVLFTNIPVKNRDIENMIDPFSPGWRSRYYEYLLDIDPTSENIKQVCINYMEGLEWTYKYYTDECYDWRWHYKYAYPPLLCDLVKYVPHFDIEYVKKQPKNVLDSRIQLSLVLPERSLDKLLLIPEKEKEQIKAKLFYDNPRFQWSFCKYFWECHVHFPYVNVEEIERIIL